MQINGHHLPESFLAAADRFARARANDRERFLWPGGGWRLQGRPEKFGSWRGGEIRLFLYPISDVPRETCQVAAYCSGAGLCPTILHPEAQNILCVGDFGVDSPVCLDYGQSLDRPRVIWLDDGCVWQTLAPDFQSFLVMFEVEPFP